MSWIMTYSGTRFPLQNPKAEYVVKEDIAHALSLICRFTGHTVFHYSVATHCLLGTYLMFENGLSDRLQLLFLLHDATETWYADISRPLKPLLTSYLELENSAHKIVWEAFGIEPPTEEEWKMVKEYDDYMLRVEIAQLMPYPDKFGFEPIYGANPIAPILPSESEKMFMEYLESLLAKDEAKKQSVIA